MTSQGLRASLEGIRAAKTALTDKTLSQHKLATALGITRQPVSKFFAGEPVSRSCFVQICQHLGLSWQKIAGLPEDVTSEGTTKLHANSVNLNTLVEEIRQKRQDKIQDQCGTLQMLDVGQVIPLEDMYTTVHVLEKITSQRSLEITDLLNDFCLETDFNQLVQNQLSGKLPGLETALLYSKLMVLGKPGSGKTTFLKYLAIECNKGEFQANRVAIFISLKDFTEDFVDNHELSFLKYISEEFVSCGLQPELALNILTAGKALILLDGLDEVPADNVHQVNREIRRFSQAYYKNQFVISCRIAAQQYKFPGFTEIEIADFDSQQIETFVKNWFVAVANKSREDGEDLGNLFIHQLHLPKNKQLQELAKTPILLHQLCLFFQVKSGFTFQPAKLYEQILNLLLRRWDEIRGIQRNSINLNLTYKKKLIAKIAAVTFEHGDYFFEQEIIQQIITQCLNENHYFLPKHPEFNILPESKGTFLETARTSISVHTQQLQNSEILLKLLEVQHGLLVERSQGIYSFLHVGLQEYLTAKSIVENYQQQSVNQLVNHLTEKRWQNVLLLTVSLLPSADETVLLIRQKIDCLVVDDQKIQDFLVWLHQKSDSISTQYKAASLRAFYLVCAGRSLEVFIQTNNSSQDKIFCHSLSYDIEPSMIENLAFNSELAIDEFLTSSFTCASELKFACNYILNDVIIFDHAHALNIMLDKALNFIVESNLKQSLQHCKKQLPTLKNHPHKLRKWWIEQGDIWSDNFRELLIKHRNICHNWQFNKEQIEVVKQYYNTNKLLVKCLNNSRNITPTIKDKIEEKLLLVLNQY